MAQVYRETHYKHPHQLQGTHIAAAVIRAAGALIVMLLAVRFVLSLIVVDNLPSFTSFVYEVTYPFVTPFLNLFSGQIQIGSMWIEYQSLIAMVFWAAAAWLWAHLFTMTTPSTVTEE